MLLALRSRVLMREIGQLPLSVPDFFFVFTTTGDNGHLEQAHREQWSTVHWVCVSEQSESGPFFLTQVSPYASSACLDPAVDPDTKYDPVTVIDQESKDLLCDNADKGSWKTPVLIFQTSPSCNIFTKIPNFLRNRCKPSHKGLIFGRFYPDFGEIHASPRTKTGTEK